MTVFRKGDKVNYHSIIGGPITSTDHIIKDIGTIPSCGGVAWITGVRGCVSLKVISHIQNEKE